MIYFMSFVILSIVHLRR